MDAPDVDPAALRTSLTFIRRINTLLRYNAATVRAVEELLPDGGCVLDIACGSADLHDALPPNVDYLGLDFHAATLAVAAEPRAKQAPALIRGNALSLPLGDRSVDVAVCQMALHHFDTDQAAAILREMNRVTRVGWVAADLLRRRRAAAWIRLFTLFASPMVQHDARVSVRQAWSPEEAKALGRSLSAEYQAAFGHRFLLVKRHDPTRPEAVASACDAA